MDASGSLTARHPCLEDYDYVRLLTRSRVAWEYLRRNAKYKMDWRGSSPGRPSPLRLDDGTVLLRPRRRFIRAETWGMYTFR